MRFFGAKADPSGFSGPGPGSSLRGRLTDIGRNRRMGLEVPLLQSGACSQIRAFSALGSSIDDRTGALLTISPTRPPSVVARKAPRHGCCRPWPPIQTSGMRKQVANACLILAGQALSGSMSTVAMNNWQVQLC